MNNALFAIACIGWTLAGCFAAAYWRATDRMHWAQAREWATRKIAKEQGVELPL